MRVRPPDSCSFCPVFADPQEAHPEEQRGEIRIRQSLHFVKDQGLRQQNAELKVHSTRKGKKYWWKETTLNDWRVFIVGGWVGGGVKMWSGKSFGRAKWNSLEYMTQKQMTAEKGSRYTAFLFTFGFYVAQSIFIWFGFVSEAFSSQMSTALTLKCRLFEARGQNNHPIRERALQAYGAVSMSEEHHGSGTTNTWDSRGTFAC